MSDTNPTIKTIEKRLLRPNLPEFRVGDTVRVEDFIATVERIGLRSTRFRTMDRTIVTIPNGKLADSRIESLTARDRIRFAIPQRTEWQRIRDEIKAAFVSLRKRA